MKHPSIKQDKKILELGDMVTVKGSSDLEIEDAFNVSVDVWDMNDRSYVIPASNIREEALEKLRDKSGTHQVYEVIQEGDGYRLDRTALKYVGQARSQEILLQYELEIIEADDPDDDDLD